MNKKGFTLIELLAVIVILAIIITVSIPAVTRYMDSSRKDTYVIDVSQAVNAVRTDALKIGVSSEKVYTLSEINEILDKKLTKSPYGNAYDSSSYIKVVVENDKPRYKICIIDNQGNGIYNSYDIDKSLFVSGNQEDSCHAEDDIIVPVCTWAGPYSDSALTTSISTISNNVTIYYKLTCTDNIRIEEGLQVSELLSTDSEVLSNIAIVQTDEITNGYEYKISALSLTKGASASIKLNANSVADNSGNMNVEIISNSILLDRVYLYNAGDYYTSITGGWSKVTKNGCNATQSATKNSTMLTISTSTGAENYEPAGVGFATINKVNMSGFSRLYIKFESGGSLGEYYTWGGVEYGISPSRTLVNINGYATTNTYAVSERFIPNITTFPSTRSIDISGYKNGTYYVLVHTNTSSSGLGQGSTTTISKIYLGN